MASHLSFKDNCNFLKFVPASQRNEFNSQTLKRKYIYLKPSSSSSEAGEPWSYSAKATTNCHRQSNGGDRDVKDDIPKPQVEIYPANSIKLWWDHTFPVPAGKRLQLEHIFKFSFIIIIIYHFWS